MTLDQLMAFTVADDHQRQEEVWTQLDHSFNKSPAFIRQKLTEASVRVTDKRAAFVGIGAYVAAGGGVVRDPFAAAGCGWLSDTEVLGRPVGAQLTDGGTRIPDEGDRKRVE